ncbi:MAG: hypothetical protein HRF51_08230, partial [bacterium]
MTRRALNLGVLGLLVFVFLSGFQMASAQSGEAAKTKSLYDRLGGLMPISVV